MGIIISLSAQFNVYDNPIILLNGIWFENLQKQQQKQKGEWLSGSFKPENFIPGLVIGFICGLLIDLSKPTRNHLSNKIFSSTKLQNQLSVSSNGADQELKMVCSFHLHHFLTCPALINCKYTYSLPVVNYEANTTLTPVIIL